METTFSNRVRFNWGYHDAAQAVREGRDTTASNFGFSREFCLIECVQDVLVYHPDKSYAQGWMFGYYASKDGAHEVSSENAWNQAMTAGVVRE